jgi:HD-GYP domain-containing protein (c-di-GMP phosphodiesterase class II)
MRSCDTLARYGGDEFALLLSLGSSTVVPDVESRLRRAFEGLDYRPEGQATTIPLSVSMGIALFPTHGSDALTVLKLADERLRWAKTGGANEGQARIVRAMALSDIKGFSMLDALVVSVDNKDRYTRRHSEEVMTYSLMIARQLGMSESAQRTLAVASLLHDIGKIGVPDAILRKPGPLTPEEYEAVKHHPEMGAILVSAVPGLESTLDAVRHHHERWDGGGYPFGLAGEAIPLQARLMAVADAFSAMTSNRPYRLGIPVEQALSILQAGAGTHWDPRCVDALHRAWQGGPPFG